MEDLKQYLTIPQVAEELGFCPDWVRILIKKKQLRAVKIGQWKVRPEDVEAFI